MSEVAQNPVVLVTGAAGGIGLELVRILLEDLSASVVATDITSGSLDDLAKKYPGRLEIKIGDIVDANTSEQAVKIAVEKFGGLTGLCLNAGVFGPCFRVEHSSVEKWSRAFHINVLSTLNTLKYALPELRKSKGRIVAATSGAGQAPLFAGWGFYGMSKAAVAFMIKQLSLEEPDITTLGVSPGLCDTKMVGGLLAGTHEGWGPEEVEKYKIFVSQIELITPATAGNAFARAVVHADRSLSGAVVDYDDARLPIADHLKREKDGPLDYTKHSVDSNKDL